MVNRSSQRSWLAVFAILVLLGFLLALRRERPARDGPLETPARPSQQVEPEPAPRGEPAPRECGQRLELEAGWSLSRDLAGGESCHDSFHLDQGVYLELVVEQHGIDVVVKLFEPGGGGEIRVDSPNGMFGPERVQLVARRSGNHRLEIRPSPKAAAGRFEVRVKAVRAATPQDRDRDRGARVFSEADELRLNGALQAAAERYREALDSWRAAGEDSQKAVTQWRIGWLYQQRREWRQASMWYEQAVAQFGRSGGSQRQVPRILNGLGKCYRRLDDWRSALRSFDRAWRLARTLEDRWEEASSLNSVALVYKSLGKFQQAISHYETAIARWQEIGDAGAEAIAWVNVAWLYIGLGQPETAHSALSQALRLAETSTEAAAHPAARARLRRAEAAAHSALAKVRRQQGRSEEALIALRRALALRRDLPGRPGEAITLKGLGRTHFELGQTAAALRAYEEALELARRKEDRRVEGVVLNELGWLYNEALDQPEAALDHYRAARGIFQQSDNLKEQGSSLYGAARAQRKLGELAAARSLVEEALEIVESLRAEPDDPKDRAYFLAGKQDYYELHIDLLIGLHRRHPEAGWAARALEASERRRTRTLLDVLNETLVDREMELALRPASKAVELSMHRGSLWPRRLLAAARRPLDLSLDEIRGLLGDDTVLLEYSLGETRSFLWLVSPTALEVHELPPRSEIEALARSAYDALSQSYRRGLRARLLARSAELSRVLLGPIAGRLGTKRLLVVSEEALHYIPFAALPMPSPAAGQGGGRRMRHIVEAHEIVYLPSLSVLKHLRQEFEARPPAAKQIAVIADPVFDARDPRVKIASSVPPETGGADPLPLPRLELSRQEADAILPLVPETERLAAFGFDANKRLVTGGALADFRFIHFATHTLFDQRNPEQIGVALSQVDERGRPQEGMLRPYEIYRLSLPVDLVTLSACRSGLGKEVRGEGLVGLTQGFFEAGASRVLVSFWRVDDRATAELMERFYRGIFERQLSPAAALRAAQLSMLRDVRWRHKPYYWAGFFLLGEWRYE